MRYGKLELDDFEVFIGLGAVVFITLIISFATANVSIAWAEAEKAKYQQVTK